MGKVVELLCCSVGGQIGSQRACAAQQYGQSLHRWIEPNSKIKFTNHYHNVHIRLLITKLCFTDVYRKKKKGQYLA